MPAIIGLTGGIGSGKTTVANLFAQKGVCIIDADIIAREVVAPNSEGLSQIVGRFGADILTTEGALDRRALRIKIFSNPVEKTWLNQLLHPKITDRMLDDTKKIKAPYCLWVSPLLIENQLHSFCQLVLVIDVDESTQISRTQLRDGVEKEQVEKILAAQASRSNRLAYADDIIHNGGNIEALNLQVDALHDQYLLLST